MTIEVIQRKTCDWCGSDEDQVGISTHRVVFDRLAKEVELHATCIDDATLSYLLEKGRRAESVRPPATVRKTSAVVTTDNPKRRRTQSPAKQTICSLCESEINAMGKGRHTSMHEKRKDGTPLYRDIP